MSEIKNEVEESLKKEQTITFKAYGERFGAINFRISGQGYSLIEKLGILEVFKSIQLKKDDTIVEGDVPKDV
ncbi:hypothetical protein LCGC14_2817610 [marine sediment metagenome]|uniref:Uncharacterized protein n=1 Tax=marine sediment metagenome TaxID=412755 RepID=A0A0F8YI10_9ZZZZ